MRSRDLRNYVAAAMLSLCIILSLAFTAACNRKAAGPNADAVEKSLDQAGFGHDVKVHVDHDKNLVTLNGKVRSQDLKDKAAQVAQQSASGSVISNQLSVEPVDNEASARKIESNVDDAIDHNYKAALAANHLDKAGIRYDVKNGVLTLNGNVKSAEIRQQAERLGASVPNVAQVVNKLDVRR